MNGDWVRLLCNLAFILPLKMAAVLRKRVFSAFGRILYRYNHAQYSLEGAWTFRGRIRIRTKVSDGEDYSY